MIEANTAARLAARFATLTPAQRRAFLDKMAEQGIAFSQLPIPALPRAQASDPFDAPLSYAQQRQWFLHRFEPDSAAYHISSSVDLRGALDVAALHAAFATLAARHEALRSAFVADADGNVRQIVHPAATIDLPVTDLSADPAAADARAAVLAEAPFDLARAPLLRVHLLKLGHQSHRLVLVMHHIVSDGWSMQLLIDELAAAYRAQSAGHALSLPAAPIGYADYAAWQRNWLEAGEQVRQLSWWCDTLAGAPDVLALPADRPRPATAAYVAQRCEADIPDALATALRERAQANGSTLFMALLAGFHALLYRYTASRDICVGVPVAGRNRIETERVVGLFVNTQIVRARIDGRQPLSALLDGVRQAVLGAQAHQDLPFEQLVDALQPERSMSYHPLFQVVHNHRRGDRAARVSLPGLEIESAPVGERTTALELTLDTREDAAGRVHACFHYAQELFDAATAQRLARHYLRLLRQLADDPALELDAVDLLDPAERDSLLTLGHGEAPADDCLPVHAHIARHAAAQPDAVAVICGEQTLCYGDLLDRADRLAAVLHARGIGPDDRVGIALSRSPDIIVALLAVMRAGAAYVPFDPAYPKDRLAYLFEDSAIRLLVTEPALLDVLPAPAGLPVLTLDMVPADEAPLAEVAVHPDQLAYVIYTSGSTGRPKGVCVAHGPLAMHVAATIDAYEMGTHSRELHFLSFAFDGAHERWLSALACGGSLVLRDDALWTPEQTASAMARHGVTNAGFPPAYLRQLAEYCEQTGQHPPVSLYSFGGEAMSRAGFAQARRALGAQTYINGYGPTETVVTPMVWKVRADAPGADFSGTYAPIGRPVGDRRCYLLDAELNLVPPGVAGELYIGGEGLARGYLNRPGMTAERFIPDPFSDGGARLYRTGDLARWLPDGQLEYLGRIDQQLKIRGFRIEPGEIEARIAARPNVAEAAVLAVEGPSGARLAAYVVPAHGTTVDVQAIRAALAAELPDYMVPAAFMVLDALPLTPNGKLDRRALPAPAADHAGRYVAPRSEAQRWLAGVWQDVLGVERVGLDDNFFTLGGDSLLSLKVISRVRANKALGIDLKLRDLMRTPTIGQLLPDSADSASAAPPTALRVLAQGPAGGTLPPVACVHAALGTLFDYDAIVAQLGSQRTVYGFQSRALVDPAWQDGSLAAIAADYVREWRAVQPQGPYLLLGWSLGATLATWMARELEAQGQTVQWLGLVDPFVPEAVAASGRPGWPAALAEFAARLLPGASPLAVPDTTAEAPDAASVSALLAPLVASTRAPSASLGADELAQMFVAAHRLGALAARESAVPVVRAPRSVWWRTGRDDAIARLAGWHGAPWREAALDGVDHHAIVRDARLLADLGQQLAAGAGNPRDRQSPAAAVEARPATLPT